MMNGLVKWVGSSKERDLIRLNLPYKMNDFGMEFNETRGYRQKRK
jgi:hypothetical protein